MSGDHITTLQSPIIIVIINRNTLLTTTKLQNTAHKTHTTKHHKKYTNAYSSTFTESNDQCGN